MKISAIESFKNIAHEENVYKRNTFLKYRRPRSIFMKRRRARLESPRRNSGRRGIEGRVRTLKRLVPNSCEFAGLEGLFRDTADYILSLQMKVEMMQIMVKALSNSDE